MRRAILCFLFFSAIFSLLLSPACSTTEEQAVVYDITGLWQVTLNFDGHVQQTFNFSFAGSITSGVASNLTDGTNGIYTVNNMSVEIIFSYLHPACGNTNEYYTGFFSSPTTMGGDFDVEHSGLCAVIGEITWSATKL